MPGNNDKRHQNRNNSRRKRKPRVPRGMKLVPAWPRNGFPKTWSAKLKYVDQRTLDAGLAGTDYITYRANDIYDPDQRIGFGHQPMGTDELFAIYNYATVVSSKMKVSWVTDGSANVTPSLITVYKSDAVGDMATDNLTTILEQKKTRGYQVGGLLNAEGFRSEYPSTITFSAKKDMSVDDPMDEEDLRCTGQASPLKQYYFEIYQASIAGNDPGLVNLIVEIEYNVVFSELETLGPS